MVSRWGMRFLGLVNTIVIARILTPSDFGVVTIAMIIAGAIEIFGQTGQWLAIIRHPDPTREHYDSAWSVSVLLNLALGLVIWMAAPVAVFYFHEPRASTVVHVVAFRTMIAGFENIGVVNFQRGFQFRRLSVYNTIPSIVAFVLTLISALMLRNYWALVIGIMSQQLTTIALSYIMEPYRPRLTFSKVGEIWSFSIWTLIRGVGVYLNTQVDKFAVGGFAGTATMGRYEIASDVATLPTSEINAPMIATLFPVMAKVQSDHLRRRELYLQVLYWSALICTSTAVGVALVADDMVDLVFGRQWADAKPLFPWLALAFGTLGLCSSINSAFEVVGRPEVSARIQWVRFGALLLCVSAAVYGFRTAEAIAIARFVVTLGMTPFLFAMLARALELGSGDLFRTLWRPLLACLLMAVGVRLINGLFSSGGSLRLAVDISSGAIIYIVTILATWLLSGRPDGPESVAWKYVREFPARPVRTKMENGRSNSDPSSPFPHPSPSTTE